MSVRIIIIMIMIINLLLLVCFCYYDRYTIRKKSLTWTQKLSDQLNLAHVARKNMIYLLLLLLLLLYLSFCTCQTSMNVKLHPVPATLRKWCASTLKDRTVANVNPATPSRLDRQLALVYMELHRCVTFL